MKVEGNIGKRKGKKNTHITEVEMSLQEHTTVQIIFNCNNSRKLKKIL